MTLLVLAATAAPRGAAALDWEMPSGTMVARDDADLIRAVEIRDGFALMMQLADGTGEVVTVELTYETTASKFGDYHIDATVVGITSATGKALKETTRLGQLIEPGQVLRLTFGLACIEGRLAAQICLHGENPDGSPEVVCETPRDMGSSCTAPEPIDGSLINAAPERFLPNTDAVEGAKRQQESRDEAENTP